MEGNISSIGQVAITVSDVGKALGFYRDVLGLPFLFIDQSGEVRFQLLDGKVIRNTV
jgi:catechol 2,3-dioxygenase-like lactoylglutathione lyase family enzyme